MKVVEGGCELRKSGFRVPSARPPRSPGNNDLCAYISPCPQDGLELCPRLLPLHLSAIAKGEGRRLFERELKSKHRQAHVMSDRS